MRICVNHQGILGPLGEMGPSGLEGEQVRLTAIIVFTKNWGFCCHFLVIMKFCFPQGSPGLGGPEGPLGRKGDQVR